MKEIVINDRLYGKYSVTEPVLLELIDSSPVPKLREQDREMRTIAEIEKFSKTQHMGGYNIVYVTRVEKSERPKFI